MKLPNAYLAVVEHEKISAYLLDPAHPDNGGKAAFFLEFGFRRIDWQALTVALEQQAMTAEVTKVLDSAHGQKYIVDGQIDTPSGRKPVVRSIWILDRNASAPRLVTAYPLKL